ncbi:hypothetical protein [Roseateles sp.]|uniref:hypothetical protein n=1 Tax=Roseateles sp. TaxID=1971397 RepID=UPI002F3FDB18
MQFFNVQSKALNMLRGVARLNAAGAAELANFLAENLEKLQTPTEAYRIVSEKPLKAVDPDTAVLWFNNLLPFIYEVLPSAVDGDEVATGLVHSAQAAAKADGNEFTGSALKKLRANLLTILDNATVRIKAKAMRLLATHERALSQCEIFSDIRPVFKTDGKIEVESAVVYHTLRIEHTGSDDTFSIALDSHDLKRLKKAVERAIEKESALSTFIAGAGIGEIKLS